MEFSSTRLVGTKRNDNFYFPYFYSFSDLFWLKWTITVFLLFFEFFTIFAEFSITLRVGTKRNDNFYFLSFPAFSNLFWLIMRPHWYFLIFWIFLLFFWNFLLHIGQEQNGTIIFIFSLSQPLPTYFGLKWGSNVIFLIFLISFLFFFEFSITHRVGTERNGTIIFIFSLCQPFQAYFGLKWSHNDIF